ncbi:MAG TPA: F0F1 ATP synthase subunit B [Burkholderiales bacterium]|jgi:F-type H+-transporting ATPase subunit b
MNINFTLLAQAITFAIFIWFTVRFVWPPLMRAVAERQQRIADGLAAAERGKQELDLAQKKAVDEMRKARESNAEFRTAAEKQAAQILDDARQESARLIAQARLAAEAEAGVAAQRAKEELRGRVAELAVVGAERILRREIDAKVHAELLSNLKQELR